MDDQSLSLLDMTAGIVAHYVSRNALAPDEVAALIVSTHAALNGVGSVSEEEIFDQPTAAKIRKSVREEGLVSFVDGRTYQSLTRHLRNHGLTPDDYRSRYGLPAHYPMVSPSYSAKRSVLAKAIGLGQSPEDRAKTRLAGTEA